MKLLGEITLYRQVRWALCLVLVVTATIPALTWLANRAEATAKIGAIAASPRSGAAVSAPGRIQPRDGVLTLAAPTTAFGVAIVGELQAREGEQVRRGQILAVLKGRDEAAAEVAAGESRVAVAQAKLSALQAGGKHDDVAALQAEVNSEAASLAQIGAETRRATQLHAEHMLSAAALEAQEARLSVATRALEAKRARLNGLSSVRPADLAVAVAELAAAQAEVSALRAKLANQYVRAPSDGRILRIHAFAGQAIAEKGLLSFAQTDAMFVDAEVMEHDVARTRAGQTAHITGDVLSTPIEGIVERVGSLVGSREVFELDPTAFADSRVVHVLIRVKDPTAVERFINARVTVEIET